MWPAQVSNPGPLTNESGALPNACGAMTLTAELQTRTQAFEMRCYRRLLNISYKDHVTNEGVRTKIQSAIGKYDELLTLVKKRNLMWFGHSLSSSGLAKTILQKSFKFS